MGLIHVFIFMETTSAFYYYVIATSHHFRGVKLMLMTRLLISTSEAHLKLNRIKFFDKNIIFVKHKSDSYLAQCDSAESSLALLDSINN